MNYGTPEQSCYRKKRYSTKKFAMAVACGCMLRTGQRIDIYECEICGGYHLTKGDTYDRTEE